MRYFVSYANIFSGDDNSKRESLRLQTYNMIIHFLTRKNPDTNFICYEFKNLKNYFESKEFTSVYFLSPYVLNENQLSKDLIKVVMESGETNSFNEITKEIKDEVKSLKAGTNFETANLIRVATADAYLDTYLADQNSLNEIELNDAQEQKALMSTLISGYKKGDYVLSVLYLKLLTINASSEKDIVDTVAMASVLDKNNPNNTDIKILIAKCYNHQLYQKPDKYTNVFAWYKKAADLNNSEALYMIGLIYFLGLGKNKNKENSMLYWSKAAALNNPDAISGIGIYYLSIGNKAMAKTFLERSAESGDYKALLLLDTDFDRK